MVGFEAGLCELLLFTSHWPLSATYSDPWLKDALLGQAGSINGQIEVGKDDRE